MPYYQLFHKFRFPGINKFFPGPDHPEFFINTNDYQYTNCCIDSPDVFISVMGKGRYNEKIY